jgi:hypothetical protein
MHEPWNKSHRELYPDQYTHGLCGKHVHIITRQGGYIGCGIVYRVVTSRFEQLAMFEHDQKHAYSILDLFEAPGPAITPGLRIRAKAVGIDRLPDLSAPAGATGTVVGIDHDGIWARFDAPIPGAEQWDNQIQWHPDQAEDGNFIKSFWDEVEPLA